MMSESGRDLWPGDLGVSDTLPPVAILREQAALLAKKTKGLLEGEVVSRAERRVRGGHTHDFLHEFRIRAPGFGDYTYSLFDVRHDYTLYPVSIRFHPVDEEYEAKSEDEFLRRLEQVFSDPETRTIIDALLLQIQA